MVSFIRIHKLGYRGLIMSLYKIQNLFYLTIHTYKHMYILANEMYTQIIFFLLFSSIITKSPQIFQPIAPKKDIFKLKKTF